MFNEEEEVTRCEGKRHRTWTSHACFRGAVSHSLLLERLETRKPSAPHLLGSLGFCLVVTGAVEGF